ncbi:McrC family protein [Aquidulcibacter paucihalophilus]|uniref:McrC family protein n=1 Tax=Aquidulcibacter paucihalophilus TaxID=1978549 RepID=UPI000A19756C|nr:hypothetical protein [Aquidulcibacter paucihalophilus]
MPEVRRWTIFEHGALRLQGDGPSVEQADALFDAAVTAKSHLRALHWKTRLELMADRHVGIVTASGCQVEILPKLERDSTSISERTSLVRMLQHCGDIPFVGGEAASANWDDSDLLEIFARCYLQALLVEARRGLPRAYIREEDDLRALRGRWDPIRQYTVLAARPNRLACAFDEFSLDTPLNRMLKAAARVVRFAVTRPAVQALALEAEGLLEEVTDLPPSHAVTLAPLIDRTNHRLLDLLNWAKLLLQGSRQDTRGGTRQGFRILFDMAEVFERYAAAELRSIYQPQGWSVTAQGGRLKLVSECDTGVQAFETLPDVILRRGPETWIIDTKWKRLEPPFDAKHGVAQSDLYQMAAYARRYNAQKVTLLYPHWSALGPEPLVLKSWNLLPFEPDKTIVEIATLGVSPAHYSS